MYIIMNIIILLLEVIYYSLFIKIAKRKNSFIKYFLGFLIANIISLFIGFESFYSYLLYFIEILIIFKIMCVDFNLFDFLIIIISMIFKILIEFIFFLILKEQMNLFIVVFILGMLKISMVVVFKNLIKQNYIKFKKIWNNNNFYIRYIFNIIIFIYIISSVLFILYN